MTRRASHASISSRFQLNEQAPLLLVGGFWVDFRRARLRGRGKLNRDGSDSNAWATVVWDGNRNCEVEIDYFRPNLAAKFAHALTDARTDTLTHSDINPSTCPNWSSTLRHNQPNATGRANRAGVDDHANTRRQRQSHPYDSIFHTEPYPEEGHI